MISLVACWLFECHFLGESVRGYNRSTSERYNLDRTWMHWNRSIWEDMVYPPTSVEKSGLKAAAVYIINGLAQVHDSITPCGNKLPFLVWGKKKRPGGRRRDTWRAFWAKKRLPFSKWHMPDRDALRILVCGRTYQGKWIQWVSYLGPHSHVSYAPTFIIYNKLESMQCCYLWALILNNFIF